MKEGFINIKYKRDIEGKELPIILFIIFIMFIMKNIFY